MAHKAKVHMSGKIIKTFQCKIGYGKVTPTKCLWVGGLGPWVQYDLLEKIFSSFGTIVEIDWPLNKNYAYILFDNVEAAIAACDKLRGHSLGDGDRRIKVDFSDETHVHNDPGAAGRVIVGSSSGGGGCGSATELVVPTTRHIARVGEISLICGDTYRFSSTGIAPITSASSTPSKRYSQTTDNQNSGNTIAASSGSGMTIEKATMVFEMIKCMRHVWTGRFLLKNNYFGSRMYHLRGESQMVHHFMQQHQQNRSRASVSGNGGDLRIDRKLALDNHLLDDVYLRITSGGDEGICIMLAVADTAICTSSATAVTESAVKRNLKALSAYLRIKQAAGKIILEGSTDDATGFGALHIFPPCSFSQKLLVDSSPLLTSDYGRDDFLLLILVRCY